MHWAAVTALVVLGLAAVVFAVLLGVLLSERARTAADAQRLVQVTTGEADPRALAVVGLARDIMPVARRFRALARRIRRHFPNAVLFVGEDGSRDGTAEFLRACEDVVVVDTSAAARGATDRIDKMARLRNHLQQAVLARPERFSHWLVIDWDLPMQVAVPHFSRALDALDADEALAAVSGVGLVRRRWLPSIYFYDTFAHRDPDGALAERNSLGKFLRLARRYRAVGDDYAARVRANFGGLAFYRARDVARAAHDWRAGDDVVCEHVLFQRQLKGDVLVLGALRHYSEQDEMLKSAEGPAC